MIFNLSPLSSGLKKENQGGPAAQHFSITFLIIVTRVHYHYYHLSFCCPPAASASVVVLDEEKGGEVGRGGLRAFCRARALQVINIARGGRRGAHVNIRTAERVCVCVCVFFIAEASDWGAHLPIPPKRYFISESFTIQAEEQSLGYACLHSNSTGPSRTPGSCVWEE